MVLYTGQVLSKYEIRREFPCTDSAVSAVSPGPLLESRGTGRAVSRVMAAVTLPCLWGHPHRAPRTPTPSTKCLPSILLYVPQKEVHGELTPAWG